jgi:HlyD family secretion protein
LPPPRKRALLLAGAALLLAVAAAGAWHRWLGRAAVARSFIGMVRTTEIRIAPEVSGRMAGFRVASGQTVAAGQPVAMIVSPELSAAVDAAGAQVEKARSDRDRVYAGVRVEEVQALAREVEKAQAVHAQDVLDLVRKATLSAHAFASQQEFDIARDAEARSAAEIRVSEARYAEAQRGPTPEERTLADASVAAAEAARAVVEARAAKLLLRAPMAGTIATLVAEPGEAVVPGEPVLTMIPQHGVWFGFDMREDQLRGLAIGGSVSVRAASGNTIPAKVAELRDWGEFAVWRAARATGDHDLNTFFVRLDAAGPVADLSPGQTVSLLLPGR